MVEDSKVPYSGEDAGDRAPPRRPLTGEEKEARRAAAEKADGELTALERGRRGAANAIARKLEEIDRLQLHECFGFTAVWRYAIDRGVADSRSHVCQMLHLVRALAVRPSFNAAFERAVEGTKLRESLRELERLEGLAGVPPGGLPPAVEAELIEDARTLGKKRLEDKYRAARGDPEPRRRTLKLAPSVEAAWDEWLLEVRRDEPDLTESEALGLLLKAVRNPAASGDGSAPRARIVIHAAVIGDVATRPGAPKAQAALETAASAVAATIGGRDGDVPLSRSEFEEALGHAEINEVRAGPTRIRKTVPPRKARFVHDRDQGRCKAPGCMNRGYLHLHHEGGRWVVGHDPAKMLLLCSSHHRMVHGGFLTIRPVPGGFWFVFGSAPPVLVPLDRGVIVNEQTSFAGLASMAAAAERRSA